MVKGLFWAVLPLCILLNSAQASIILSDRLGVIGESSLVGLPFYFDQLCINCTDARLPRALGAIAAFSEKDFAQIIAGKTYVVQALEKNKSALDADKMLRAMGDFLRVLRKSIDSNSGIYEKALLRELVLSEPFLKQSVVEEIGRITDKALSFEVATKVRLLQQKGTQPTPSEVLDAMCPFFKRITSCKTKNTALLSLSRFFTSVIEQLSAGMKVEKTGSTLYDALKARLEKLESAGK